MSWSCSGCELRIDGKFIDACPPRQIGEDSRYALGFDSDCRGAEIAKIEVWKSALQRPQSRGIAGSV